MTRSVHLRPMEATRSDLTLFKDCFDANDSPRDLDRLEWQYLGNPRGQLWVDFAIEPAENGERVVGIYAILPVNFKVGNRVRLAGQSVDVLVDSRATMPGLFLKLVDSVYARCKGGSPAFVYGFPNGNVARAFFSRLRWTSLDPVPFLVKPLRTRYFLRKIPRLGSVLGSLPDVKLPRVRQPVLGQAQAIQPISEFDERFDHLWAEFSRDIRVAVQRDSRYLQWRFGAKPNEQYRTYGFFDRGVLRGFVTYCVKPKHGGRIGYIMELIYAPTLPRAGKALLRHALRDLAGREADMVLAWSFEHSPNYSAFARNGFYHLPERIRPIELHFGFRSFDASEADLLAKRENWYLSYCDSDSV